MSRVHKGTPGARSWTYHVGRSHYNRVTVFCVNCAPGISMEWWEDGATIRIGLGHRSRAKAMEQATDKARQLAALGRKRPAVGKLVAMRSDLARVAKLQGYPDGMSPSLKVYQKLGRFGFRAVQGVFRGFRYGQPRDSWRDAMHRFGLRSPYDQRRPTQSQVEADIRRVAHAVGSPRRMPSRSEYDRLGSWDIDTVTAVLGLRWDGVAAGLGLEMDAHRLHMAGLARERRRHHEQQKQNRSAA